MSWDAQKDSVLNAEGWQPLTHGESCAKVFKEQAGGRLLGWVFSVTIVQLVLWELLSSV